MKNRIKTITITIGLLTIAYNIYNTSYIADNSIHQIYYTIKICGGWLMVITGLLIKKVESE